MSVCYIYDLGCERETLIVVCCYTNNTPLSVPVSPNACALFCHGCYNLRSVGDTAVLREVWGELLVYYDVFGSRVMTSTLKNTQNVLW